MDSDRKTQDHADVLAIGLSGGIRTFRKLRITFPREYLRGEEGSVIVHDEQRSGKARVLRSARDIDKLIREPTLDAFARRFRNARESYLSRSPFSHGRHQPRLSLFSQPELLPDDYKSSVNLYNLKIAMDLHEIKQAGAGLGEKLDRALLKDVAKRLEDGFPVNILGQGADAGLWHLRKSGAFVGMVDSAKTSLDLSRAARYFLKPSKALDHKGSPLVDEPSVVQSLHDRLEGIQAPLAHKRASTNNRHQDDVRLDGDLPHVILRDPGGEDPRRLFVLFPQPDTRQGRSFREVAIAPLARVGQDGSLYYHSKKSQPLENSFDMRRRVEAMEIAIPPWESLRSPKHKPGVSGTRRPNWTYPFVEILVGMKLQEIPILERHDGNDDRSIMMNVIDAMDHLDSPCWGLKNGQGTYTAAQSTRAEIRKTLQEGTASPDLMANMAGYIGRLVKDHEAKGIHTCSEVLGS